MNICWSPIGKILMPTAAAITFLLAAIDISITLSFHVVPKLVADPLSWTPKDIFRLFPITMLVIAVVSGLWTLTCLDTATTSEDAKAASDRLFSRYLIGLGWFLLVTAVVTMVSIAGLASNGLLASVLKLGQDKTVGTEAAQLTTNISPHAENVLHGTMLMMALVMTLLGALFYFANSLWTKFRDPAVNFDRNIFWGGLWFRLAEAVVFTIAIFVFLRYQGRQDLIGVMPMIGLFVGMAVKSAEKLIFGLINRILAGVTSFVQPVPTVAKPPPQPPAPPAAPPTSTAAPTVTSAPSTTTSGTTLTAPAQMDGAGTAKTKPT